MKKLTFIHIALIQLVNYFLLNSISYAQDSDIAVERVAVEEKYNSWYGLDATLINGKKYQSYYSNTMGHQFMNSKEFGRGTLTIKGIRYLDCLINYDIFNQCVILKYFDSFGSECVIEISKAWLEDFILEGIYFKNIQTGDGIERIFQKIGDGDIVCLYYYSKNHNLNTIQSPTNYSFSEPIRTSFLMINGLLYEYKNNRSFIKVFSTGRRESIRRYLKDNRIKVKTASDYAMTQLMNFCNSKISESI